MSSDNKTMDTPYTEIVFNTTFRLACSHHQIPGRNVVLKMISIYGVSIVFLFLNCSVVTVTYVIRSAQN